MNETHMDSKYDKGTDSYDGPIKKMRDYSAKKEKTATQKKKSYPAKNKKSLRRRKGLGQAPSQHS